MNAVTRSANDCNISASDSSFENAVKDAVDKAWRGVCPMGDCLRGILEANRGRQVKEEYSVRQLSAAMMFECKQRFPGESKELCAKVHGSPCNSGCVTCHFCRQKTTSVKAMCSNPSCKMIRMRGRSKEDYGWCGSCLSARFGENILEVMRPGIRYLCPVCRDICNCSSPDCYRGVRGLVTTGQLSYEAKSLGYKSAAHYLILTQLSREAYPPEDLRFRNWHRGDETAELRVAQRLQPPTHTLKGTLQSKSERRRAQLKEAAREQLHLIRKVLPPPPDDLLNLRHWGGGHDDGFSESEDESERRRHEKSAATRSQHSAVSSKVAEEGLVPNIHDVKAKGQPGGACHSENLRIKPPESGSKNHSDHGGHHRTVAAVVPCHNKVISLPPSDPGPYASREIPIAASLVGFGASLGLSEPSFHLSLQTEGAAVVTDKTSSHHALTLEGLKRSFEGGYEEDVGQYPSYLGQKQNGMRDQNRANLHVQPQHVQMMEVEGSLPLQEGVHVVSTDLETMREEPPHLNAVLPAPVGQNRRQQISAEGLQLNGGEAAEISGTDHRKQHTEGTIGMPSVGLPGLQPDASAGLHNPVAGLFGDMLRALRAQLKLGDCMRHEAADMGMVTWDVYSHDQAQVLGMWQQHREVILALVLSKLKSMSSTGPGLYAPEGLDFTFFRPHGREPRHQSILSLGQFHDAMVLLESLWRNVRPSELEEIILVLCKRSDDGHALFDFERCSPVSRGLFINTMLVFTRQLEAAWQAPLQRMVVHMMISTLHGCVEECQRLQDITHGSNHLTDVVQAVSVGCIRMASGDSAVQYANEKGELCPSDAGTRRSLLKDMHRAIQEICLILVKHLSAGTKAEHRLLLSKCMSLLLDPDTGLTRENLNEAFALTVGHLDFLSRNWDIVSRYAAAELSFGVQLPAAAAAAAVPSSQGGMPTAAPLATPPHNQSHNQSPLDASLDDLISFIELAVSAHYPRRNGLSAAGFSLAPSQSKVTKQRAEVALSAAYSILMRARRVNWMDLLLSKGPLYLYKPFSVNEFWKVAPIGQRKMTHRLLAKLLNQGRESAGSVTSWEEVPTLLLSHWLRACLDPDSSDPLRVLTHQLSLFPATRAWLEGPWQAVQALESTARVRGSKVGFTEYVEDLVEAVLKSVYSNSTSPGAGTFQLVKLLDLEGSKGRIGQSRMEYNKPNLLEVCQIRNRDLTVASSCTLSELMRWRHKAVRFLLATCQAVAPPVKAVKCSAYAKAALQTCGDMIVNSLHMLYTAEVDKLLTVADDGRNRIVEGHAVDLDFLRGLQCGSRESPVSLITHWLRTVACHANPADLIINPLDESKSWLVHITSCLAAMVTSVSRGQPGSEQHDRLLQEALSQYTTWDLQHSGGNTDSQWKILMLFVDLFSNLLIGRTSRSLSPQHDARLALNLLEWLNNLLNIPTMQRLDALRRILPRIVLASLESIVNSQLARPDSNEQHLTHAGTSVPATVSHLQSHQIRVHAAVLRLWSQIIKRVAAAAPQVLMHIEMGAQAPALGRIERADLHSEDDLSVLLRYMIQELVQDIEWCAHDYVQSLYQRSRANRPGSGAAFHTTGWLVPPPQGPRPHKCFPIHTALEFQFPFLDFTHQLHGLPTSWKTDLSMGRSKLDDEETTPPFGTKAAGLHAQTASLNTTVVRASTEGVPNLDLLSSAMVLLTSLACVETVSEWIHSSMSYVAWLTSGLKHNLQQEAAELEHLWVTTLGNIQSSKGWSWREDNLRASESLTHKEVARQVEMDIAWKGPDKRIFFNLTTTMRAADLQNGVLYLDIVAKDAHDLKGMVAIHGLGESACRLLALLMSGGRKAELGSKQEIKHVEVHIRNVKLVKNIRSFKALGFLGYVSSEPSEKKPNMSINFRHIHRL
ncbi:hypothetical protein CEUSTIGMA_g276.t1 [Chlamydomonas eustigma]|uniref:Zinc-finger domain-containing protein n=1 Tax=Chlamydomonas eustigma TaxID=1157962 RepID=A0A250WPU5_9CHLO|nr:hypothetical protein CEUSTIGMA_g276.t1 [Chlamydomonas eustigma]|eukprot:GAX72821.1 hypothetical protein CEUSTIGMA_g276.t1 [Chlamydomonas eustigma]